VVASNVSQPGQNDAFVTDDGGRTWSASSMLSVPFKVQCFPDARCVSIGEGASYSTDNGLKWLPASFPVDTGTLSCGSSQTCMTTSGATVLVSDDGGQSWSGVDAQGLPASDAFVGLECPTVSDCWISGDALIKLRDGLTFVGDTGGAVVLSSVDGGKTWQSTELPKGITGVGALSCPEPSTCFAIAYRGPLVTSSSSGLPLVRGSFALLVYRAPRQ
jgi:photosystem II stability/assembly factor-like uncharacterized protein